MLRVTGQKQLDRNVACIDPPNVQEGAYDVQFPLLQEDNIPILGTHICTCPEQPNADVPVSRYLRHTHYPRSLMLMFWHRAAQFFVPRAAMALEIKEGRRLNFPLSLLHTGRVLRRRRLSPWRARMAIGPSTKSQISHLHARYSCNLIVNPSLVIVKIRYFRQ